ncbi:MAG: tRNA (N6-isopentenyl adenosine(37)-C2)-methylthiotransferase MiaB [Pedosphaera sp.]|nr:tRNA (N6-isopentenyl adenosine(37)-C2)-methylthiotransferase MiaB [Pedosphaera sp.]
MKKVFIKTYGCQMNERDSEAVGAMLRDRGYALTRSEGDADVILLNTCSVRDQAEQKALGKMTELTHLKRSRPNLVLGFMGCMAQSRGKELLDRLPDVDLVIGTQKYHRVVELLEKVRGNGGESVPLAAVQSDRKRDAYATMKIVDIGEEKGSQSTIKDHIPANGKPTAFVSIMQGCDMHCTFCIVPSTRGSERSRSIVEIVTESRALVANGVKEITLLGQIVTSYGRKEIEKKDGKTPFVQLLEAMNAIDGLERIRFTSPHPLGFKDDLIEAYGRLPKLCEYVHLPVQSGSNRLLKEMHRGYTRESYLEIVAKLRRVQPNILISTDIIVGFPGETEEDFEQTYKLVEEVEFDHAFIFKYSERKDTPAATMPDQIGAEEKLRRNHALLALLGKIVSARNEAMVGQTMPILVEGVSKRNKSRMFGRTRTNKVVVFPGSERHQGQLLDVRITRASITTLYGDPAIFS